MKTVQSKDVVRLVRKEEGKFLVSFNRHDAYFAVPEPLQDKILKAEVDGREVTFTYDRDCNIVTVE